MGGLKHVSLPKIAFNVRLIMMNPKTRRADSSKAEHCGPTTKSQTDTLTQDSWRFSLSNLCYQENSARRSFEVKIAIGQNYVSITVSRSHGKLSLSMQTPSRRWILHGSSKRCFTTNCLLMVTPVLKKQNSLSRASCQADLELKQYAHCNCIIRGTPIAPHEVHAVSLTREAR